MGALTPAEIARSLLVFALAGVCEIGGGYLFWLWLREGRGSGWAAIGAIVLSLYGILPALQPATFDGPTRPTAASLSPSRCCGVGAWMG